MLWYRRSNIPSLPAFQGHIAGCYENEDGHVVVDLTVADGNVFFWWPPDENITPKQSGKVSKRDQLNSQTTRWILDPKNKTNTRIKPAFVWNINGEFSRIDDRWVTKKYKSFWQAKVDPSKPYDFEKCGPPAGGLFNSLGKQFSDTILAELRRGLFRFDTALQCFSQAAELKRTRPPCGLFLLAFVWNYFFDDLIPNSDYYRSLRMGPGQRAREWERGHVLLRPDVDSPRAELHP